MSERSTVILVNLLNGKSLQVVAKPDPITGETYVEHNELLSWSVITECEEKVRSMWADEDGEQDPFIGFVNDGDKRDIVVLRNHKNGDEADEDDTIAFRAVRLPNADLYGDPNKIPKKGGS